MNHQKKAILIVLCVLMFLILAPSVIFYGLGYQYDFDEKEVVQTGAIIVKISPSQTDVFLNGKLQNKNSFWEELLNNFVKINQLKVGEYNLKIKKDDHFSWEKNIEVKEGIITKLENVILLPINPEIKNVISENLDNFWFSQDNNKIAYTVFSNQKNIILNILDLDNPEKNIAEFKLLALKSDFEISNLKWSKDKENIVFEITGNNTDILKSKLYLVNLKERKIINLDKNFKLISSSQWQSKDDTIFYLKNNDLYRINYSDKLINLFSKNISAYTVKNNFVYYTKSTPIDPKIAVYKIKNNGLSDESLIIELPAGEEFDKIEISADDQIILRSKDKKLYLADNDKNLKLINSSVADFQLSEEKNKLFYFNGHEIWIYYLEEKIVQPAKEKDANELVTRLSDEIKNVVWYSTSEHLFFQAGEIIKFIELDNRDKRNCYDFIKLESVDNPLLGKEGPGVVNDSLVFDPEKNKLYFLDKADGENILREVLIPSP